MNTRQVSKKIKSVTNVKKITKAMQLVSAVKMRKAQLAAVQARPYQQFIEESIRRMTKKLDTTVSQLLSVNTNSRKKLIILITSNKGLCGSFNTTLLRFLIKSSLVKDIDVITIGKKGAFLMTLLGVKVLADFSQQNPLLAAVPAFELSLEKYLSGQYQNVQVVYNKFVNTLRTEPVIYTLLPFHFDKKIQEPKNNDGEYLIEPAPHLIIETLIKNYIEEKIRFSIQESEAGEHSSRMMAMKNATDNAGEVILNLTSLKNKLRQQKITNELLDMITAKESVEIN